MKGNFQIDFAWQSQESGTAVERATLAELKIIVDETIATKVEDLLAKTVRDSIRVSAYRAALWFASNWWRLRWEPERRKSVDWRMAHNLAAAGGGYVWPDLTFSSDGQAVAIRSRATPEKDSVAVRYLNSFDIPVAAEGFETGVDNFLEAVIARLDSECPQGNELIDVWAEVCSERRDPDKAGWRKLEALLGFDPDEGPEEVVEELQSQAKDWGADAVEEVAAAEGAIADKHLRQLLDVRDEVNTVAHVPEASQLKKHLRSLSSSVQPWQRAETAAAQARRQWGLADAVVQDETLTTLFELPRQLLNQEEPRSVPMSAGFLDGAGSRFSVFLNKRRKTGRRFALVRLVGDYLLAEPADRLLPATRASTARQKFQRAFAQEFLCPFNSLREYMNSEEPDDDDIEAAAEHFAVSTRLVETTLVNRGVLDRSILPE